MKGSMKLMFGAVAIGTLPAVLALGSQGDAEWTEEFYVARGELRSTGRNPYFILEPGYQSVLEGGRERLTITVLEETRVVDGVETRVVEERETVDGRLHEISRNYFAISARTNSVFYFGEEVDMYRDGSIVSHSGAWLAGVDGARFGLMMPGLPLLESRYYQEVAPGVALDRARIVRLDDQMQTPAGNYTDVLVVEETTPLEPQTRDFKYYARGVGLLRDASLRLVRAGRITGQ